MMTLFGNRGVRFAKMSSESKLYVIRYEILYTLKMLYINISSFKSGCALEGVKMYYLKSIILMCSISCSHFFLTYWWVTRTWTYKLPHTIRACFLTMQENVIRVNQRVKYFYICRFSRFSTVRVSCSWWTPPPRFHSQSSLDHRSSDLSRYNVSNRPHT